MSQIVLYFKALLLPESDGDCCKLSTSLLVFSGLNKWKTFYISNGDYSAVLAISLLLKTSNQEVWAYISIWVLCAQTIEWFGF